jgi:hypothetical protein
MAPKLPPQSRRRPAALPKAPPGPPKKRRKPAAPPAAPPAEPSLPVAEGYVDRAPDADRIAAFAAHRAQRPPAPPRPQDVAHDAKGSDPASRRRAALAAFLEDEEA